MRSLDPVRRTRVGAVLDPDRAPRAIRSSDTPATTLRLAATLLSVVLGGAAQAGIVTVDARSNIFGAGHALPPDPGSYGPGILPASIALFAAPLRTITFDTVTGTISAKAVHDWWHGADGGPYATGTTDILSYGGISGIKHDHATMFLVGVFTDGTEPVGPGPVRLDVSDLTSIASFTPALFQTFFIGDGRTGTGSGDLQVFHVPDSATSLFLGFADAFGFGDPIGLPGSYDDNGGALTVSFTVVPTPGAVVLAAGGAVLLLSRRTHRA